MSRDERHTPGPWAIRSWRTEDSYGWEVICDQGLVLHAESAESEANVDLIAAAPELLEALLRMRDEVREFLPHVCGEALMQAEAAIRKARGEAP